MSSPAHGQRMSDCPSYITTGYIKQWVAQRMGSTQHSHLLLRRALLSELRWVFPHMRQRHDGGVAEAHTADSVLHWNVSMSGMNAGSLYMV